MDLNIQDFSLVDYIIILIILLSVLFGFFKGFLRSVLSLLRLIISFSAAMALAPSIANYINDHVHNPAIASYLAFIGNFIFSYVLVSLFIYFLLSSLDKVNIGGVDRFLGGIFGLLRGNFVVAAIFLIITTFSGSFYAKHDTKEKRYYFIINEKKEPSWLKDSESYDLLLSSAKALVSLLPAESWENIQNTLYKAPTSYKEEKGQLEKFHEQIETIIIENFNVEQKGDSKKLQDIDLENHTQPESQPDE